MNLFPDELKEQAKDFPLYSQDEDEKMKPLIEALERVNDLMKQAEEIEKETEGKVFESDLDYITKRLKELSEYNEENFTELKETAKKIQKKNRRETQKHFYF